MIYIYKINIIPINDYMHLQNRFNPYQWIHIYYICVFLTREHISTTWVYGKHGYSRFNKIILRIFAFNKMLFNKKIKDSPACNFCNHIDDTSMRLLPDTENQGLRMHRECRECFPRHRLQRKSLVSDHSTCVTHVPWCMSGSIIRGGGENIPGIPGTCAQPTILRIW